MGASQGWDVGERWAVEEVVGSAARRCSTLHLTGLSAPFRGLHRNLPMSVVDIIYKRKVWSAFSVELFEKPSAIRSGGVLHNVPDANLAIIFKKGLYEL